MLACKPAATPMDSTKRLGTAKNNTPVDRGYIKDLLDVSSTYHTLNFMLDSLLVL